MAQAACPVPLPLAHPRWAGEADWLALQRAGLRYGRIRIRILNVYDLAHPGEDTWYGRTADFIHIKTHPWVIRQLLLIAPGEPVNARRVYESERRLRSRQFLRAVSIRPHACRAGRVETLVTIKDAWTLKFDFRFAHAGGASQTRFKFKDTDFLGTGRTFAIGHVSTLERSENLIQFASPSLGGTPWSLSAEYAKLSDGQRKALTLAHPFLLDTASWSARLELLDQNKNLYFYNDGTQAWQLPVREQRYGLQWLRLLGWSGATALRAGFAARYARYRYGTLVAVAPQFLPAPAAPGRILAGVGPAFNLYQDRYANFYDIQTMGHVEDYDLGWQVNGTLLLDAPGLGASASGPALTLTASRGLLPYPGLLLRTNTLLSGRYSRGRWRNLIFSGSITAYDQSLPRQTLVGHLDYASVIRPDPENLLYIGGFQALRGYPNFFLAGTRRVRITLADRIVTPTVLFHTFQLGYVAFLDAARIERVSPAGWSHWYADLGAGFRIGNLRGAFSQVIYATVAFPLVRGSGVSSYEIIVGNVLHF